MAKLKTMSLLLAGSMVALATPVLATGGSKPSCPSGQYYWDGKGATPAGTIKQWQYGNCVTPPKPTPTPTPTPTPAPGSWSNSNATGGNANAGSNSNSGADADAKGYGYGYGTGGSVDSTNSNSTKVGIDNVGNGNGSGNKLNSDSNSNSNSNSGADSKSNSSSNSGGNSLTGKQDVTLDVDTDIALDTNVNASSSNKNSQNVGQSNSNASQGNTTNVDASDRSSTTYVDKSRTIFIPPVVPSTPPSQVAIGNIIKETLACGPLQRVIQTPIVGTRSGIFTRSKVDQGFTYDLAPFTDAAGNIVDYRRVDNGDGSTSLFGHQVVMFTTVVGISGGGNIAIGGGSGNGDWGQGGFGNSSSNTRLVTNIQLVQCEVGTLKPTIVEVPVEVPVKKIGG